MIRTLLLAVVCLVGAVEMARAQDNQALIEKIDRLERDIRTMERMVYRGEVAKPNTSGATTGGGGVRLGDSEIRMSDLETQMRFLTGKVEEVDNRVAQLEQRFEKLLRDLDLRLRAIELRLAGLPIADANDNTNGQAPPAATSAAANTAKAEPTNAPAAASDPATTLQATTAIAVQLPDGPTEDKYNFAMNLLRTHKYDQAEGAFTAFLDQHGSDRLAGHAKYWLGETFYVRRNFDAAAKTYLTGYQEFPNSAKAPDMLLKLSVTLVILGEKSEACVILEELSNRFPDATSAIRNRARRERKNAGCG